VVIPRPQPYPFKVERARKTWDNLLARMGDLCLLRQPGLPDRWITAIIAQETPLERLGQVSNPLDRTAFVSSLSPETGLELDPDPSEKDTLIVVKLDDEGFPIPDAQGNPIDDHRLKIVRPPDPMGPSHHQLYWRLAVRR
jgi:hypothetical protein